MPENTKDLNTTYEENTEAKSEHHSHHEHSHHSHSHHSHSHHSHSHHSHSGYSSHGKSGSSSKSSSAAKKKFSLANYIRKKSTSRSFKKLPRHRVISQRLLFCFILVSFILGSIMGVLDDDAETTNQAAINTRSETDQLKSQITMLQLEKSALENELERYKALYGELEDETKTEKKQK